MIITPQLLTRLEYCFLNAKTDEAKTRLFRFTLTLLTNKETTQLNATL